MTRELATETLNEERVVAFAKKQASYAAREALQQIPSLEQALDMWLRQARAGRFEVKIDTSDLEPRLLELRGIARMLTLGVVLVGVLIASSIAANAPHHGTNFDWIRDAGLIAYATALVLATALGVSLLRSPRQPDRRRGSSGGLH